MKPVGGLDILKNAAILTGTFWQPDFVNTLESEGLSNTVYYKLCLFMRLLQLINELHWECLVRVGRIIVLVYELCHIFQGTCFTKIVFFQVPPPSAFCFILCIFGFLKGLKFFVNFCTLDISAGVVSRTVQQLVRLSVQFDREASPYGLVVSKVALCQFFSKY